MVRLIYPLGLLVVTVFLSAEAWSGTSVGSLTLNPAHGVRDASLVIGTPRPIRSDEWNVLTPLTVAQSHHGYSPITLDGVGSHNLSVIPDIPNTDWSTAFKPWDLPMLALDVQHGFAARWWLMSLILLLGAYLLLLAVTDRTDISILFSLGLWLSPFFHWWYASISLDSVGMGMLALGAWLYAIRAPTLPRRAAWIALAAYSLVGFILLFYPPFQVPTALILLVIGVCDVIGRRAERSLPWRRLIADFAALASVVGVILIAYYVHDRATIAAVNGTLYPGHRRATGGGTSLQQLLSAPFGLSLAQHGAGLSTTNQSEISSFVLFGPFALLQLQRIHLREFMSRWRVMLSGMAAVFLVLLAWYLISLPPIVAKVLLLDRAEPQRAIIGVGAAGILLMAFFCAAEVRPVTRGLASGGAALATEEQRRRVNGGAVICAALAFGMYFWAGRNLITRFPTLKMTLWGAGLASAAAAVVVLLTCARKALMGGVALVALGALVSLPSNPLYRGLGALTTSPLLSTIAHDAATPSDATHRTWLSFGNNLYARDIITASGAPTLTAINTYPNVRAWEVLDPKRRSERVWNRYANVYFFPAPSGAPPKITLLQQDVVQVIIDPCGVAAQRLGVGFVVSPFPLSGSCLSLESTFRNANTTALIYRRTPTRVSNG